MWVRVDAVDQFGKRSIQRSDGKTSSRMQLDDDDRPGFAAGVGRGGKGRDERAWRRECCCASVLGSRYVGGGRQQGPAWSAVLADIPLPAGHGNLKSGYIFRGRAHCLFVIPRFGVSSSVRTLGSGFEGDTAAQERRQRAWQPGACGARRRLIAKHPRIETAKARSVPPIARHRVD